MAAEQLEPGTLLNERYRILRVIGRGGMGTVYQAEHVRLDTILAVKEVRPPITEDMDARALLEQCEHEARFLVRLHHPNLPQVTDAFLENGRFFVVMEYIEGVTLEARERAARPEPLPVATVIDWALQIADVLSYLHSQAPPIIFRDLKPANVMVQADGRIRLIDFGIARRFQPGAGKDTNLLGSVGFSPPEQFGRSQTDTRSDIYALGATLHNLLTGRDPSHAPFKFVPVRVLNSTVPEALSRLIDHCLRLDADARPQTIHAVAMELLSIRDSVPVVALQPAPIPRNAQAAPGSPPPAPASAATSTPSGANIILTNPTLRDTGKTQKNPARPVSGVVGSGVITDRPPSQPILPPTGAPTDSQSTLPSSTFTPEAARPSRVALFSGIAAAAAAVIGITAWIIYLNVHPGSGPANPGTGTSQPGTNVKPQPVDNGGGTDIHTPSSTSTAPSESGVGAATSPMRSVSFDTVAVKGLTVDGSGHSSVRIDIMGRAQGEVNDQEMIAVFFYDDQNNPITSQLPQTPYSSRDGKLSAAITITLAAPSQSYSVTVDVPLTAFPANITGTVQFHAVAFHGDERIGESKTFTPIPTNLLTPPVDSQPPSNPPTDQDNRTGSDPQSPPKGTFGTKPVRND